MKELKSCFQESMESFEVYQIFKTKIEKFWNIKKQKLNWGYWVSWMGW